MEDAQTIVIKEFKKALTNHPEKPHSFLNILVNNKKGEFVESATGLDVFDYDPIEKILEYARELKFEGGFISLDVEQIGQNAKGEYELILSV